MTQTFYDKYPIFLDDIKPTAVLGEDFSEYEDVTVTINGTDSFDDQMITDYLWQFENDGEMIEMEGPILEYVFEDPGIYRIKLTVFDFAGNNDTEVINVTVLDKTEPVVESQGDIEINQGETANFDAFGSHDNVGITSYQWKFQYGGEEQILNGEMADFTFDIPGIYNVTLELRDEEGNVGSSYFNVTVVDTEDPVADAGDDINAKNGDIVEFDAGGSTDNGEIVSYEWTFTYRDELVELSGSSKMFSFDTPGTYVVNLTVTDYFGNSDTDTLTLNVEDTINPVAKITGSASFMPDDDVELSASESTDNHGIARYQWSFEDPDFQTMDEPEFSHRFSKAGEHTIELTVWDHDGNSDSTNVTITVLDTQNPEPDAGEDQRIPVGTTLTLDGSNSTDDGQIVRYEWKIEKGSFSEVLEGKITEYTFEDPGTYSVMLMVYDSADNYGEDSATIEVVGTGKLIGKVVDSNGDPISKADIIVTDSTGKEHKTRSSGDGTFEIEVPPGTVKWTIKADGYEEATGESSVTIMETTELDTSDTTLDKEEGSGSGLIIAIIVGIVILIAIAIFVVLLVIGKKKKNSEEKEEPEGSDVSDGSEGTDENGESPEEISYQDLYGR